MANNLSSGFLEVWAKEYQTVWHKMNVAKMVADTSFNSQLKKGDVLNRVYRSSNPDNPQIDPYSRGSDITIQDITDTKETLTVNREFAKGIYVDDFDQIQSNYQIAAAYGRDNAIFLSNQIDADVLGEYADARNTVDDGNLGGTAGNGIVLTTSNVLKVVSECKKFLRKENIPTENLCGVISPEFEQVLIEYGAGRDTQGGDMYNRNGYMRDFYGFKLYVSNQTAGSAVLSLATQPTATDTVVVNGVTFTFVAAPAAAGDVDLGANVDATRANLAAAINGGAGAGSDYIEVSASDRRKLLNVVATNDDTANTLTVVQKGAGVVTVSETLTDATDEWTSSLQKQHCVFGRKGFTTLVMQKDPTIKTQDAQKRFGKYVLNGTLYGNETFEDQKPQFVSVDLDSSSF